MRAFRSYVPNVPMRLTCLLAFLPQITACLRAYVPTCLRAYVPTSPNFSRVYVLTCEYIFFMPTCLCALNYFVPSMFISHVLMCLQPLTTYILRLTSIPCIAGFFLNYLTFHSIQNTKANSWF